MRMLLLTTLLVTGFEPIATTSAQAQVQAEPLTPEERVDLLLQAQAALGQNAALVIPLTERIIASYEAEHSGHSGIHACVVSEADAEAAADESVRASRIREFTPSVSSVEVIGIGWCYALFMRGFSLIDSDRADEAGPMLQRASAMAPLDSQFASEYAEWLKRAGDWQASYDAFSHAERVSRYSADGDQADHRARALRGMGFAKIELADLDGAEQLFRQSLELVPDHPAALSELRYITEQRQRH